MHAIGATGGRGKTGRGVCPVASHARVRRVLAGVRVARAPAITLSKRAMRLLCADDEPDIRAILRLALSLDPDMEVEIVDSGHEAIARAAGGAFDAILLDGMMPGLDGYETCRILKADPATSHVPVLFLTAKTQRDEARRALSVGAVACLTKPFDPMTIGQELRAALLAARPG
ncbi:MAG: response regulator [Gemmatimonadales bacterium]|jgi:CheY-like chemotaxis protein